MLYSHNHNHSDFDALPHIVIYIYHLLLILLFVSVSVFSSILFLSTAGSWSLLKSSAKPTVHHLLSSKQHLSLFLLKSVTLNQMTLTRRSCVRRGAPGIISESFFQEKIKYCDVVLGQTTCLVEKKILANADHDFKTVKINHKHQQGMLLNYCCYMFISLLMQTAESTCHMCLFIYFI